MRCGRFPVRTASLSRSTTSDSEAGRCFSTQTSSRAPPPTVADGAVARKPYRKDDRIYWV